MQKLSRYIQILLILSDWSKLVPKWTQLQAVIKGTKYLLNILVKQTSVRFLFTGDDSSDDDDDEEDDSQDSDDLEELKKLNSLGLPGNGISVADVLKKATDESDNLKVVL